MRHWLGCGTAGRPAAALAGRRRPLHDAAASHNHSVPDALPSTPADAKAVVQKARQVAAEFEFSNGYPIPVAYLAKKMADDNQVYTQVRPQGGAILEDSGGSGVGVGGQCC